MRKDDRCEVLRLWEGGVEGGGEWNGSGGTPPKRTHRRQHPEELIVERGTELTDKGLFLCAGQGGKRLAAGSRLCAVQRVFERSLEEDESG